MDVDWDAYERDAFLDDLAIDVHVLEGNPLIDHHLGWLRSVETTGGAYEERSRSLAAAMTYPISEEFEQHEEEIETPLRETKARYVDESVVVPVLRAGLAARDGMRDVLQDVETGFISAWREDDLSVETEYAKLPDCRGRTVMLTDPMIATGNTISAVYEAIEEETEPERYVVMGFIAAPEGLQRIDDYMPDDTAVYVAALDDGVYEDGFRSPGLNGDGYIVPGLGDAGDRTYGTPSGH